MGDRCKPQLSAQVGGEGDELVIVELCAVVCDDCVWDTVAAIDIFPKEANYLGGSYCRQWLRLYPLAVVINGNNDVFELALGGLELSHQVKAPSGMNPWADDD